MVRIILGKKIARRQDEPASKCFQPMVDGHHEKIIGVTETGPLCDFLWQYQRVRTDPALTHCPSPSRRGGKCALTPYPSPRWQGVLGDGCANCLDEFVGSLEKLQIDGQKRERLCDFGFLWPER